MVAFPNCKINIGLRITGKRSDGFHDIESVFLPVNLKDAIEILEEPSGKKDIYYSASGIKVPGNTGDDLCVKAYRLLKKDFPNLPPVKMHLHKTIPMGAGLGGGSADASFMLRLINQKFELGLSTDQLIHYASVLGSDCPFFIINKPCYVTGRGEVLKEIPINLSNYKILLVNPGIHINTGWAFSHIKIKAATQNLEQLLKQPVKEWQHNIFNDFENPVFETHPEIASIKEEMIQQSSLFASMSGSGSTVFGIFEKESTPLFNFPAHYFWKWV